MRAAVFAQKLPALASLVLCGLAAGAWPAALGGCTRRRATEAACGSPARPAGSPGCPAAAPAAPATVVQVEVSGRLVLPERPPPGRLQLYLTDGPCFQPGSHYLGSATPAADGSFQLTVFPPLGTALEACGALVEPLRSGVAFWGRADRGSMPVHGRGKMVYRDTVVVLRRGPDVIVPAALRAQ